MIPKMALPDKTERIQLMQRLGKTCQKNVSEKTNPNQEQRQDESAHDQPINRSTDQQISSSSVRQRIQVDHGVVAAAAVAGRAAASAVCPVAAATAGAHPIPSAATDVRIDTV